MENKEIKPIEIDKTMQDRMFLAQANETLTKVDIKGKDYIPVSERIRAFRLIYPRGQIATEIIGLENGVCTMKASVFDDEGHLLGTGHAQEKESSSFINKTSYIENCETSCIGRALGSCGIGLENGFASFEEVANAKLQQGEKIEPKATISNDQWKTLNQMYTKEEIKGFYKELGISNGKDIPIEFYQKKADEYAKKLNGSDKEFY